MRVRWVCRLCIMLVTVMMFVGIPEVAAAANKDVSQVQQDTVRLESESGVTVKTPAEFLAALEAQERIITVDASITLGVDADESGKMLPVEIPGDTVITATANGSLDCRCPIQLSGDNVIFRDIEMTFSSSTAPMRKKF